MRDMTGVLLASDLDGTLLGPDHTLPRGSLEAIVRFMEAGGRFTLATGRSLMALECVRPLIPVNAPVAALNGAILYDYETERLLYGRPLSSEIRALGAVIHKRYPDLGLEVMCLHKKYAVCRNAQIRAHLDYVQCVAEDIASPLDAPGEWFKLLCVDAPERLAPVRAWLDAEYGARAHICYSAPTLLEVQDTGVTKAAGVARAAEAVGAREVYCAGDNGNDLPMMRAFPSFAPAGATEECKQAAAAVGPPCEEDFMAFVIAEIDRRTL